ncbi:MAG: response regulator, partial [Prevotella sp.]|nr:response regulator [Prevotella sp.]
LELKVARTDVAAELRSICEAFSFSAAQKDITLRTHGLEDGLVTWADADKIDKIVGNLLSNAMKFTPSGGSIDVGLDTEGKQLKLTVADTGTGIPADQMEKVFIRYYQLENQNGTARNMGTGIGLYYSRRLAKLHHGTLTAANRAEGPGAVFTLLLPMDERDYADKERLDRQEQPAGHEAFVTGAVSPQAGLPTTGGDGVGEQTILVVDDDADVVTYLRSLLSSAYRVVTCFDAASAYRAMEDEEPSIVLSDVIMPGESGYDLCRHIKNDPQLCHIPVILLTAKATVDNQIEGLNTGADAYVAKPFEPKLLLAQIQSILLNRSKLHVILNKTTQTDEATGKVLAPQDQAFMKELYRIMEDELSNPELDIARVTSLMNMSRSKLYYKMKGLTGTKPGIFFRTYKLNRAAELIREGELTMSEVADRTGFSSLSYFSTSFKRQFGVSPSEYR